MRETKILAWKSQLGSSLATICVMLIEGSRIRWLEPKLRMLMEGDYRSLDAALIQGWSFMSKVTRARKVSAVAPPGAKLGYDAYDLDMVGKRRGGKKKKSNKNVSFRPGLDSGSASLVDATGTIHMGTRSVNNSGNGDGDSKIAGQTCPNLASDGVVASPPILTPNPGMASSYANVTGKSSRTKVNFRNLFTPACNAIDVVVPMRSIRAISE
ncbi:hypothetical protein Tco_1122751 [Tanacetum coccineum]|uniref:Uncharacterized protein n=1 Tax=Tanacetum coccineum TaxID=301880 RepID=A0ABQ5J2H7_9ASTR